MCVAKRGSISVCAAALPHTRGRRRIRKMPHPPNAAVVFYRLGGASTIHSQFSIRL